MFVCVFCTMGGGVYLDSDIEVLKSFDSLLDNEAFTGFEDYGRIAAWIFGSEKGNPLFKELLDYYEGRHFIIGDGVYDMTPNPEPITRTLRKYGLTAENKIQNLGRITVYPMEYFCPFNPYRKGNDCFTEATMANHHFNGTWLKISNEREERYKRHLKTYQRIFGRRIGNLLTNCQHVGIFKTLYKVLRKLARKFKGVIVRCKGK